jgi:putative spermidine/putrescine transport system ATP-binding protein
MSSLGAPTAIAEVVLLGTLERPAGSDAKQLDEYGVGAGRQVRLRLREQIPTLPQRLGTTTLFVTRDQEEALSMADRVGVMQDGKQIGVPGAEPVLVTPRC